MPYPYEHVTGEEWSCSFSRTGEDWFLGEDDLHIVYTREQKQ